MNKTSILLALDGSEQAHQAAQLALHLAGSGGATITAQHVIDTKTAWGLLGTHKAGLIGSGLYIAVYEKLVESLRDLANHLAQRYDAISAAKDVKGECLIDEGNPFEMILERMTKHDLLLIGHEATATKYPHFQNQPFTRASLAGALANASFKPILIVQQHFQTWKTMKIFCAVNDIDSRFIGSCSALAANLGLKPELAILNPDPQAQQAQLESQIKEACKDFADMPMEIIDLADENDGEIALWAKKPIEIDLEAMADSLLVVPTKLIDGKRATIFGSTPGSFLRHLTLPQIMLYPQDSVVFAKKEEAAKSASSI